MKIQIKKQSKPNPNFLIVKGILVRRWINPHSKRLYNQIVVPSHLHHFILYEVHDQLGHLGQHRNIILLQSRYYWRNYIKDMMDYINTCHQCQMSKSYQKKIGNLHPIHVTRPWEIVGIDIKGPLPKSNTGEQYLLVCQDHFTKWIEVFPLRSIDSESIINKLKTELFSRYGSPETILSDNASYFISQKMNQFLSEYNIKHKLSNPYRPQTNGTIERLNRTISEFIEKVKNEKHKDWKEE